MTKAPSPKADQLRAMRESRFGRVKASRKSVQAVRDDITRIPAKKPRRRKK
jgi:hypothetical protein